MSVRVLRRGVLYWHRLRLKRQIALRQRHNHPITSDGTDWVTGNVLKPCGCDAPADVKLGFSRADWGAIN